MILVNEVSTFVAPVNQLGTKLAEYLNETYANTDFISLMGTWSLQFGPCIYAPKCVADTAYVVVTTEEQFTPHVDTYAISIAGSNPLSMTDFLVYDSPMGAYVDYTYGSSKSLKPQITRGMNEAFQLILNTPSYDLDLTLVEYLSLLMKEYHGTGTSIEVVVTGGSMGGSLALLVGLYLSDVKKSWDPDNNATISVYSFAAFSFGNDDFKMYFESQLGNQTDRIWNALDMVPCMLNPESLQRITSLYIPWGIPQPKLLQAIVAVETMLLAGKVPVHVNDQPALYETLFYPVTGKTPLEQFFSEAAKQHFNAYMDILGCPQLITFLGDNLEKMMYFKLTVEQAKKYSSLLESIILII